MTCWTVNGAFWIVPLACCIVPLASWIVPLASWIESGAGPASARGKRMDVAANTANELVKNRRRCIIGYTYF
jgi:hypothetical protein